MTSRSTSREEASDVSNHMQTSCSHDASTITTPLQLGTNFGAFPGAPVYDRMPRPPNQGPSNPTPSAASVLSPPQPLGDDVIPDPPHIPATPLDPLMVAQAPHIDHINPESGPVTGGTKVNILGENLHPELRCVFGGSLAHKTWVGSSAYECRSPPKPASGQVEVSFEGVPNKRPKPIFTYEDNRKERCECSHFVGTPTLVSQSLVP